jgi:S1-C subfamily serine protease
VLQVDGWAVQDEADFQRFLSRSRSDRIPVIVLRNGQRETLFVSGSGRLDSSLFGLTIDNGRSDRLAIARIAPSSFWAQAGLRTGDVIVAVAERPVDSIVALRRVILQADPGTRLPVVVERDGTRQTVLVTVDDVPGDSPYDYRYERYANDRGWLGVYLDNRYDNYAVVEAVERGSAADQAGIRAGDWILRVNGQRVQSPGHLSRLIRRIEPGTPLDLTVSRRQMRELNTVLGERPEFSGRFRYDPDTEDAEVGRRQTFGYRGDEIRIIDEEGGYDAVRPQQRGRLLDRDGDGRVLDRDGRLLDGDRRLLDRD